MILLDTNVLAELCRQRPDPAVERWTGNAVSPFGLSVVTVEEIQDDHIVLSVDDNTTLEVGDKISIIPSYQDMLVNRWDQYIAVRNGIVEQVWDIPGRGCTQ